MGQGHVPWPSLVLETWHPTIPLRLIREEGRGVPLRVAPTRVDSPEPCCPRRVQRRFLGRVREQHQPGHELSASRSDQLKLLVYWSFGLLERSYYFPHYQPLQARV